MRTRDVNISKKFGNNKETPITAVKYYFSEKTASRSMSVVMLLVNLKTSKYDSPIQEGRDHSRP